MNYLSNRILHRALVLCACLAWVPAPSAWAASYDIFIDSSGFSPSYLEVTVGDRVYWWNVDYDLFDIHSTRSYSYPWDSGPIDVNYGVYLDTGKTGTYDYVDEWGLSGSGTLVINPSGPPPPTFIPAPYRVDMVYDEGRDTLYITSQSNVLRYQLSSDSFLPPFQLSGSLRGIDLSPDGNTLVVADASANSSNVWVHVLDLNTGQTNRATFPIAFAESGTFAVAFGGDGAVLVTSRFAGSGLVPLRRYDPVSGSVTTISSFLSQDSMVSGSGDGTTIIIAESNNSGGAMDLYDVAKRSIVKTGGTGYYNYECAASRDGSFFALPTYFGTFIYNTNFNQVTNIGVYAGAQPIGAAFHPAADAVFFPFAGTSYVRAYSTTNWSMLQEYDFQNSFTTPGNHAFDNGRIRISPDGQIIFVTVSGGIRYLRHNLDLPLTHRLLVTGNPGLYGVPSPVGYGSYWLPHGTNLTLSVPPFFSTNGTAVISSGWTGTGSAAGSGTSTSTSFPLTANATVTWNWTPFVVTASLAGGGQVLLQWPSVDGTAYDVQFTTNLSAAFVPVASNLPATPPMNSYQTATGPGAGFYRIRVK